MLRSNPHYHPDSTDVLNSKGVALDDLKKYTEAIAYYDQVLTINPHNTDALNNKGVAYAAQEKYEEAILCYNQFLKINPKHVSF